MLSLPLEVNMKIIFLDLDNTLINADYNLTVPEKEFRSVADELSQKGTLIGLCSDSAVATLRQWAERLGLTGPIVAERGSVIWDPERGVEELLNPPETGWFADLRKVFLARTPEDFRGSAVMLGDATRFVKNRAANSVIESNVLAINGLRIASFSLFACRSNSDGNLLIPDVDLLSKASDITKDIVASLGKKMDDLYWDENPTYGILIVHAAVTEKYRGVASIIDRFKPEQTAMVGDGISDFLGLPDVSQYAVSNASNSYKSKSTFVSGHPLTEGVIECLKRF
jgi:hydroxymethylpyrimidine pyrophosphatase-like HAD family hydrolase